jgi:hypothetical protein
MNNRILTILLKRKQLIALSVVAIAMAVYIFPLDILTNDATAQRGDRGDRGDRADSPYGRPREGPPDRTPGEGPPEDRGPPAPRGR